MGQRPPQGIRKQEYSFYSRLNGPERLAIYLQQQSRSIPVCRVSSGRMAVLDLDICKDEAEEWRQLLVAPSDTLPPDIQHSLSHAAHQLQAAFEQFQHAQVSTPPQARSLRPRNPQGHRQHAAGVGGAA